MMCIDYKHWDIGDFWGPGKHGYTIESKGWCLVKKRISVSGGTIALLVNYLKASKRQDLYIKEETSQLKRI